MDKVNLLPGWARDLREKYLAGESSTFVLYGNVFDKQLVGDRLLPMSGFIFEVLLKDNKTRMLELSVAGLAGIDQGVRKPLAPDVVSAVKEAGRLLRATDSVAVVIPHAHTLFPAADTPMLSSEERLTYVEAHGWTLDEAVAKRDNVVILLTESLAALNQGLVGNPRVAAVRVPFPDWDERFATIELVSSLPSDKAAKLADRTAGLRLSQIEAIIAEKPSQGMNASERETLIAGLLDGAPNAADRAKSLAALTAGMSPAAIRDMVNPDKPLADEDDGYEEALRLLAHRKKEIIEKECAGLIEVLDPSYGFEAVGGLDAVKVEMAKVAQRFKEGDSRRAPMGLLAVGPMGAGKTFVVKAFLKEAGLPGVVLKNFRSKWVGSTESNLEQVLATVKAMGPVALVIDEGDRSFGSQSEDSDGGTSSRVIARLKEFMSDTDNRGKVLFILMTNRPDKLDADIKRPGRLDRKIPFFYPETDADRQAVFSAVAKRSGTSLAVDWTVVPHPLSSCDGYSNADLEAVAILAAESVPEGAEVDNSAVNKAVEDFMPPRDSDVVELMNLLAVMETSRRSLLPGCYRNLTADDLKDRIRALKAKTGLR